MRTLFVLVVVLSACADDEGSVDSKHEPLPTLEQARDDLATVLRRDTDGLTSVTARDGSLMMATGGRFGSAVLVRKNADGTTSKACVEEVAEAERFLGTPAAGVIAAPVRETR